MGIRSRQESSEEQPNKQHIIPVEQYQLNRIVEQHVSNVNYLTPPTDYPVREVRELDQIFYSNKEIWEKVIDRTLRYGSYVTLESFFLVEWLPRSPGLYFTNDAKEARNQAKHHIESIRDNIVIYNPYGKMSMLDGGIGNIRLKPINIGEEEYVLISASSNGVCHEGFPVAVPAKLYDEYIDRIIETGAVSCSLTGKLKFISDKLRDLYEGYAIPQLYLLVEEIQVSNHANIYSHEKDSVIVTVAVSFIGEFDDRKDAFASFVTFFPGYKNSFEQAVRWMEEDYIIGKYKGKIITDFDQQQCNFSNAVFSLEKVMNLGLTEKDLELITPRFINSSKLIRHQDQVKLILGDIYMGSKYNISCGDQSAVGDNAKVYNNIPNQTPQRQAPTESSLSMVSPSPNNGDNGNWWLFLIRLIREKPWVIVVLVGIVILLILLVAAKKIRIPGLVEPNTPETQSPEELKVRVNLFCKWNSQGRLNHPIQSATVTATSVLTGNPINVPGIDDEGRISFKMDRTDEIKVRIRHLDIQDSQISIPSIQINESDSELQKLGNTVRRDNCYYGAKPKPNK